jgi:hypothetical protein
MCKGVVLAGGIEVQAHIDAFLANCSQSSLELPPLTSEQRRQVKEAAAQHVGLRCESFGFGKERRVHLFKTGDASPSVTVRNTFIDGFADTVKSEEALFSTVPAELPTLLRRKAGAPEMLQESDLCPQVFLQTGEWLFPADEPAKRLSVRDLVGLPPGLRSPDASKLPVRNTFIEVVNVSSEQDKRAVQSLPHGMFRQQLLAEALGDLQATATKTGPQGSGMLSAGCEVVIVGLVKLPAFNGRRACVESFDAATGRYTVIFAAGTDARQAKVKRENLVVVPRSGSDAAPR